MTEKSGTRQEEVRDDERYKTRKRSGKVLRLGVGKQDRNGVAMDPTVMTTAHCQA